MNGIDQALQGQAAGVQVTQSSGTPEVVFLSVFVALLPLAPEIDRYLLSMEFLWKLALYPGEILEVRVIMRWH